MTESTKCPQCSGEMPANFPPGVCPACLLQQGMSPSTLTGAAGEGSSASDSRGSGLGRRPSWTPPTPAELAPKFPALEIAELLGQGGMGAVYKVRQKELDRWAALKILPGEVASDPNFAERFQREARALAQLSHQHIVTVYEFGQRDGVFFLLMEFVDGVTLRQAIRAGTSGNPVSGRALAAGPVQLPAASALPLTGNDPGSASPPHSPSTATISAPQALAIVTQLCDALQFAHEEGIVHRDIKPENILIDKRGRVKIADFGLAKLLGKQPNFPTLTGTHQIMGTPAYMAPEQMEGSRSIDHRADIFSLGVVFYELLTGELPLGRFAPPSQKYSLDVRLDEVVLRTLEKNPDRRYQQASEVKLDVESIRSQPVAAKPTKLEKPRQPWTLGRVALVSLIVLMGSFAGLLGGLVIVSWLSYASFQVRPAIDWATDPEIWGASQNQEGIAKYREQVARESRELQRQKQLEEAAREPLEANSVVQFTPDGVKLHPHAFGADELTAEQRVTVEKILTETHQAYLKVEARHTNRETMEDGTQVVYIEPFDRDFSELENTLWSAIDSQFPIAQQKLLRQRLPLLSDTHSALPQVSVDLLEAVSGGGMGGMSAGMTSMGSNAMPGGSRPGLQDYAIRNLRYQQLLGWKALPLRISINRRGKWYRWKIGPQSDTFSDSGETPELPSALRRFWHEPSRPMASGDGQEAHVSPLDLQPPDIAEDLGPKLLKLDGLRAADKTPWEEVEKRTNELLAKYTAPADKGRIHWMAAHVYGQSDIRGHAADVTRHAQEALKYERDPIQRGWLYMYLGDAAGLDAKSKDEAARWYLKGYLELLPYQLPDKAPELPVVNKIGGELRVTADGETDPDQIASEVVHAAQMKARKDAEFIRELVSRRDIYIGQLQTLFGRKFVEGSDEAVLLKQLATEILHEEGTVMELIHTVWPQSDPIPTVF